MTAPKNLRTVTVKMGETVLTGALVRKAAKNSRVLLNEADLAALTPDTANVLTDVLAPEGMKAVLVPTTALQDIVEAPKPAKAPKAEPAPVETTEAPDEDSEEGDSDWPNSGVGSHEASEESDASTPRYVES